MVNMACDALDTLGSDLLVLDFKMGASSMMSPYSSQLICKAGNCYLDRLEACAAKQVPDFPTFACCNNRGKSYFKCAEEQGVTRDYLDSCVNNHESDQVLLDNSEERINAELPTCYLPDVLFNDRNDRCIKFRNSQQLITVLCGMYGDAGIHPDACQG
ncbi:hypothetical protein V9T40_006688 [Parthenolecanium corni]|uniref:Uncharacterized protein n=1 Tax=Parthenolecanium corni TaxID=536013 RepID=A0AAN9U094_9HEMI